MFRIFYCLFVFIFIMNKDKYGEVFTSPEFIQEMIENAKNIMGDDFFTNINIFEPGSGKGVFFDVYKIKINVLKIIFIIILMKLILIILII